MTWNSCLENYYLNNFQIFFGDNEFVGSKPTDEL